MRNIFFISFLLTIICSCKFYYLKTTNTNNPIFIFESNIVSNEKSIDVFFEKNRRNLFEIKKYNNENRIKYEFLLLGNIQFNITDLINQHKVHIAVNGSKGQRLFIFKENSNHNYDTLLFIQETSFIVNRAKKGGVFLSREYLK